MPYFYDFTFPATTHATPLTSTSHIRMTSGASTGARVLGVYAAPRGTAAGGGMIKFLRCGTIGTGGTAIAAPNGISKRDPNNPTAVTGVVTTPTAGATPMCQFNVAFAQTGGQGAWVATEYDHAPKLVAGGGTNGNCELASVTVGASQSVDIGCEFFEA